MVKSNSTDQHTQPLFTSAKAPTVTVLSTNFPSSVQPEELLNQPHSRLADRVVRWQLLLSTRWLHKVPGVEKRLSFSHHSRALKQNWLAKGRWEMSSGTDLNSSLNFDRRCWESWLLYCRQASRRRQRWYSRTDWAGLRGDSCSSDRTSTTCFTW